MWRICFALAGGWLVTRRLLNPAKRISRCLHSPSGKTCLRAGEGSETNKFLGFAGHGPRQFLDERPTRLAISNPDPIPLGSKTVLALAEKKSPDRVRTASGVPPGGSLHWVLLHSLDDCFIVATAGDRMRPASFHLCLCSASVCLSLVAVCGAASGGMHGDHFAEMGTKTSG